MLKKQFRLNSDFHFNVTRKYGKKVNYELFTLYVCKPTNYAGNAKIGIITPNSFNKSAVKRNKAKRAISELARLNLEKFPENNWILIYPRPVLLDTDHEKICTEFNKALSEIFIP